MPLEKPLNVTCAEFTRRFAAQTTVAAAQGVLKQWREILGSSGQDASPVALPIGHSPVGTRVGIWERSEINGEAWFVRTNDPDQRFWSQVERFGPKAGRKRIILIGESVARGWGHDPLFNCSSALTAFLPDGDKAEVIDLARSGLAFPQVWELVQSALHLDPDCYVIFAGNNWLIPDPSALDLKRLGTILRESGSWRDVELYIEDLVRNQVGSLVTAIGRFSREHNIPFVLVIPESNLVDWPPNIEFHNPLLSSGEETLLKQSCWLAEEAISSGDLGRAEVLAAEIVDMEQSVSPNGFHLMARCAKARGDLKESRRLFERARDAMLSLPVHQLAACFSVIQNELRTRGAAEGLHVVDMPQRLTASAGNSLVDRRWFLDHVHMTIEGIREATAAVAEILLPLLGLASSQSGLPGMSLDVTSKAGAQAHFAAAVLNALAGQDQELVRYHSDAAARTDPEILQLMSLYLECKLRRIPDILCPAFHALQGLGPVFPGIVHHFSYSSRGQKELNLTLLQTLAQTIAEGDPSIYEKYFQLLREEHQLNEAHADLRHPSCWQKSWKNWQDRSYMTCTDRESIFHFINRGESPLHLRLTSRVPGPATAKQMSLLVNDNMVDSWPAMSSWHTRELTVGAEALREGRNTVVIQWPDPEYSRLDRIRDVSSLLSVSPVVQHGFIPNLYITYGEIHAFESLSHAGTVQIGSDAIQQMDCQSA